jgi:hypothetical protein
MLPTTRQQTSYLPGSRQSFLLGWLFIDEKYNKGEVKND